MRESKKELGADFVQVIDATAEDVVGIRYVVKTTWIDTYLNEEYGITKTDIEQTFNRRSPLDNAKWLEKRRRNINSSSNQHEWVVKDKDKVVGWCFARKGTENHIQTLYILPQYQKRNIGRTLLQTALNWIGANEEVSLNVAVYNQKAINFYKRFGFIESGTPSKNDVSPLYSGKIIPEIVMVRNG